MNPAKILSLTIMAVLLLSGCSTISNTQRSMITAGIHAAPDQADAILLSLVKIDPKNAPAYFDEYKRALATLPKP